MVRPVKKHVKGEDGKDKEMYVCSTFDRETKKYYKKTEYNKEIICVKTRQTDRNIGKQKKHFQILVCGV